MTIQMLHRDTMAGPKPIAASSGWVFDKTATITWSWLRTRTRQYDEHPPRRKQYETRALAAEIRMLAIVLSNALGMSPTYWERMARDFNQNRETQS